MLISKVVIFQAFIEQFAIITVIFWILRRLLLHRPSSLQLSASCTLYSYFFYHSSCSLNFLLDHFDHLRFHVFNFGVEILVADLLTHLGHHFSCLRSYITVLVLQIAGGEVDHSVCTFSKWEFIHNSDQHGQSSRCGLGRTVTRTPTKYLIAHWWRRNSMGRQRGKYIFTLLSKFFIVVRQIIGQFFKDALDVASRLPDGRRFKFLHRHPEEIDDSDQNGHDFVIDKFADDEQDSCHEFIGQFFVVAAGSGHLVVDDRNTLLAVGVLAGHKVFESYLVEYWKIAIAFVELLNRKFLDLFQRGQAAVLWQVVAFAAPAQRVLSRRKSFPARWEFFFAAVELFLDWVAIFGLNFDFIEGDDCGSIAFGDGVEIEGGVMSWFALARGEVVVWFWLFVRVIVCSKTGIVLGAFGSEIVGWSDLLAVSALAAGVRIAWRQQHGSSQSLHPLDYFLGLIVVLPLDGILLLLLQYGQSLQVALEFINLLLQILGLIETMSIRRLLLQLLQRPQLHDCFSIQIAEVGEYVAVLAAHHFLIDGCLFAIDQERDESHLVEDVDVVGVVLMEGEAQQQEGASAEGDVAQFSRLVVGVGSGLEGGVAEPHPAVLVVLLPLHLDLGADLVLVGEEGDVAHLRQFQQLDHHRLREGGESPRLPALCLRRLQHQLRDRVLWVLAGTVVYAEVYSARLAFHQQTYCRHPPPPRSPQPSPLSSPQPTESCLSAARGLIIINVERVGPQTGGAAEGAEVQPQELPVPAAGPPRTGVVRPAVRRNARLLLLRLSRLQ